MPFGFWYDLLLSWRFVVVVDVDEPAFWLLARTLSAGSLLVRWFSSKSEPLGCCWD